MARKKQARLNSTNNPLNSTETVLESFEQVSKSTSPALPTSTTSSNKSTSQTSDKKTSQQSDLLSSSPVNSVNQSASQLVNIPTENTSQSSSLRKATFQIDSEILDSLDRYHLQLQLDLGKRNAPFKEIIVELALKNILLEAQLNPEHLLELLQQQQLLRS